MFITFQEGLCMKTVSQLDHHNAQFCARKLTALYHMDNIFDYPWDQTTKFLGGYGYILIAQSSKLYAFITEETDYNVMRKHLEFYFSSTGMSAQDRRVAQSFAQSALKCLLLENFESQESLTKHGFNKFPDIKSAETQLFLNAHIAHFGEEAIRDVLKVEGPKTFVSNFNMRKFGLVNLYYQIYSKIMFIESTCKAELGHSVLKYDQTSWTITDSKVNISKAKNSWDDIIATKQAYNEIVRLVNDKNSTLA